MIYIGFGSNTQPSTMLCLCVALICWTLAIVSGSSYTSMADVVNLHKVLKNRSKYDRHIVPLKNQDQTLDVDIFVLLSAIDIEFIEVEKKVKVLMDVKTSWTDENLYWDPAQYGDLQHLHVQGDWVWRPEVLIRIPQKGTTTQQIMEGESKELEMVLDHTGKVFRHTTLSLSLFCSIDTTDFPFDEQYFMFILAMSVGDNVRYSEISSCLNTEFDNGNPRWSNLRVAHELIKFDNFTDLMCTVSMKRKPLFYVINIILPVVFLGYLEVLVFVIPADAGEKLSYAVALLLSYSVFVSFVADNIPEDSDNVSDLIYYIIFQFFIGAFAIFCTTLQLRLYHRDDEKDIPYLYRCTVKFVNILLRKRNKVESCPKEGENKSKQSENHPYVPPKEVTAKYKKTTRVMRRMKTKSDLHGQTSASSSIPSASSDVGARKMTWHNVSSAIDFILFWIFLITQIVLNMWFFYPAYKADR